MKNNIVLIGMPGVGKSTAGVILAKILGYKFIDMDIVIQEREGRLLKDIIEDEGVDGFIAIENDVNKSVEAEKSVIATGGSVVYGAEAMEHLKEIGTVVYLKINYETIEQRVSNVKGRGVVLRDGQTLKDIYEERSRLYMQYADVIVTVDNETVEETIEAIIAELNSARN